MTIATLPSISDKSANTTRLTAAEFNMLLDATVQGSKPILTRGWQISPQSYTTDTAITIGSVASIDSSGGARSLTLADPGAAGIYQVLIATTVGNDITITCATAGALDGTNEIITMDTQNQALILLSISSTRWTIIKNEGSVVLST